MIIQVDENIAIEMKFKGNETYLTELLNHDNDPVGVILFIFATWCSGEVSNAGCRHIGQFSRKSSDLRGRTQ